MKWLRGKNCDYQREINDLTSNEYTVKTNIRAIWKALKRKESIKAIFFGCSLMFFQQLCGINVVVFYTNEVFHVSIKIFRYLGKKKLL